MLAAVSKTAELREGCKSEGNETMESQYGICHDLTEDVVVSGDIRNENCFLQSNIFQVVAGMPLK